MTWMGHHADADKKKWYPQLKPNRENRAMFQTPSQKSQSMEVMGEWHLNCGQHLTT